MVKKTVTYVDFGGNERTEELYFNLNKAEVIKWLTTTGDYTLDKVVLRLSTERNGKKIMEIFDNLLEISYGKPSLDFRRFEKTEEIWRDFKETEAYSIIFTELVTDAKVAADFITAIIPKDLADEIAKIVEQYPDGITDEMKDYLLNDKKKDANTGNQNIMHISV